MPKISDLPAIVDADITDADIAPFVDGSTTKKATYLQLKKYFNRLIPNTQTGTSYTLVADDDGKVIRTSNASSNTITVPLYSSVAFPVGTQVGVRQHGSGTTTIVAAGGVTINATGLQIESQYGFGVLVKVGTNEWDFYGGVAGAGAPTVLNAVVLSAGTPTSTTLPVTWTDTNTSPNENGYEVQVSPAGAGTWTTATTTAANATSYTITGRTASTAYDVRVISKGDGSSTADSAASNTVTMTTSAGAFDIMDIAWNMFWNADLNVYSDFSATPATDGGVVSEWREQIHLATGPHSNSWDLIQGTPANKPTYRATGMNSKPAIETGRTGSDTKFLYTSVFSPTISAPISIVMQAVKTGALIGGVGFLGTNVQQFDLAVTSGNKLAVYQGGGGFVDTSYTVVNDTHMVIIAVFKSGGGVDVWVNGTQVGSNLSAGTNSTMQQHYLSAGDANVLVGKFRHRGIYAGDLTADVADISDYLMDDLGI